jgi:hemerythrin-like metal-binding protein
MSHVNASESGKHMRAEITEEHRLLRQKLSAVAELCPHALNRCDCAHCTLHSPKHCGNVMADMGEDLMTYMVAHFRNEERVMRDTGLFQSAREACERHMQDHGDLSESALQLLTKLNNDTLPVQIADMSNLLGQWLECHISEHDNAMLELLDKA